MSENDCENTELAEMFTLLGKSADSTLILNLITPYLVSERKAKLSKKDNDLLEIIRILVINQMKLQNDFRTLLMFLNKKEIISDNDVQADLPELKSLHPESMYL